VPPEDRIRRDQRRDLREHTTSQALTEDGETPTIAVTQLQPSTAQLSLENSVLLAQEFDHVPLLLFEPSEERRDKELQRNHGASLCQCLVDPVLRHNGQTPFFERRLQDHLLAQEPRCRCAVRLEDNAHTNRDHELEHKHVQDHVIRARFNVGTVRVLILAAVAFSFESLFSDCPNRRQGRRSAPPGTISGRAGLPDAPSSRSQPLGVIGSGRSATRSEIEAHRVLLTNSRM